MDAGNLADTFTKRLRDAAPKQSGSIEPQPLLWRFRRMNTQHAIPILEVKASAEGRVTGYGSTFGNIDSYGDTVMPGAFAATLDAHRQRKSAPLMLWMHDRSMPVGRWEKVGEDSHGLHVEGVLNMRTVAGKEAYEHLSFGSAGGLSIGYTTAREQMRGDINVLHEVNLHEVSIVSMPADSHARVTDVKQGYDGRPSTRREFEMALKSMGYSRREAEQLSKGFGTEVDDNSNELKAAHSALADLINTLKV